MIWGGKFYRIATMSLWVFFLATLGMTVLDKESEQASHYLAVLLQ